MTCSAFITLLGLSRVSGFFQSSDEPNVVKLFLATMDHINPVAIVIIAGVLGGMTAMFIEYSLTKEWRWDLLLHIFYGLIAALLTSGLESIEGNMQYFIPCLAVAIGGITFLSQYANSRRDRSALLGAIEGIGAMVKQEEMASDAPNRPSTPG